MKYSIKFHLLLIILLAWTYTHAQSPTTLSGKVISADSKQGIPGVSITFQKQSWQTITDNNGLFTISLSSADTLVISHVSYLSKKMFVNSQNLFSKLLIELENTAKELDEVVISTGFQHIPKERATGSFDYIDNKTINLQVGTNVLARLNGVANSVLFDNTKLKSDNRKLGINVRGLSTINGSQDPLIVVDNFPYEGSIDNLNPNDIESITVLRDAAAASIWGTRAGNGVVVITTKRGRFNSSLKIDVNTNVIVNGKPDLYSIPQISSSDYIDVEQFLYQRGAFNSMISSPSMIALSPALEIFLKKANGQISTSDSTTLINSLKQYDVRDDYLKYVYQPSVTQTYSLNIRGGSNNIAWLISAGYDRGLGALNDKYDKLNVRLENTFKPLKYLQIHIGAFYTNSSAESGKTGYSGSGINIGTRNVPYIRLADQNGGALSVATQFRDSYTDTAGAGKLLDWRNYPLDNYKHTTTTNNLQSLLANIGLSYQINPAFSMDLKYQYQSQQSVSKALSNLQSYEARSLINYFSEIDRATGIVTYHVPLGSILNQSNGEVKSHNLRGQLNYSNEWKSHSINTIVGAEVRQTNLLSQAFRLYGYNDDLLTRGNVDFLNEHPTFITGSPSYISDGISLSGKLNRFISLFGNTSYIFKDKYIVSGSIRRDASNLFGLTTNDKWRPFWSAGIAWKLSKEAFYKSSLFPEISIRATYGYSGNVDQTKSAVTVLTYGGANSSSNLPIAQVTQYANPSLRWEKVKTTNIGIDISSKSNRISASIEYYQKKGVDLFGPSPIDYTSGLNDKVVIRNIASMDAKGVDLNLKTKNINKSFIWESTLLVSFYKDKTTSYYIPPGAIYLPGFGSAISPIIGKSLYSIISYPFAGLDRNNGNPLGYLNKQSSSDYNAIRIAATNVDSLAFSGSSTPKLFGSIGNQLSWKGLSLSFNILYRFGYYFRKPSIDYRNLFESGIGHSDFSKRWEQPGDEIHTNIPSMVYPSISGRDNFYLTSTATVVKGDHIRLQFINLSYDLRSLFTQASIVKSLQVYFNISNLGILWRANDQDIDPDYPSTFSPSKTFAFGIRSSF